MSLHFLCHTFRLIVFFTNKMLLSPFQFRLIIITVIVITPVLFVCGDHARLLRCSVWPEPLHRREESDRWLGHAGQPGRHPREHHLSQGTPQLHVHSASARSAHLHIQRICTFSASARAAALPHGINKTMLLITVTCAGRWGRSILFNWAFDWYFSVKLSIEVYHTLTIILMFDNEFYRSTVKYPVSQLCNDQNWSLIKTTVALLCHHLITPSPFVNMKTIVDI